MNLRTRLGSALEYTSNELNTKYVTFWHCFFSFSLSLLIRSDSKRHCHLNVWSRDGWKWEQSLIGSLIWYVRCSAVKTLLFIVWMDAATIPRSSLICSWCQQISCEGKAQCIMYYVQFQLLLARLNMKKGLRIIEGKCVQEREKKKSKLSK